MNNFHGEKLKELRISRGMSQKDFAAQMGISDRAISKWETGLSQPSAKNLILASKILNVSVEYFTASDAPKVEETPKQENGMVYS